MGSPLPNRSGKESAIKECRLKPVSPPIGLVKGRWLAELDSAGFVDVDLVGSTEQ
jgi:hypothetical protein